MNPLGESLMNDPFLATPEPMPMPVGDRKDIDQALSLLQLSGGSGGSQVGAVRRFSGALLSAVCCGNGGVGEDGWCDTYILRHDFRVSAVQCCRIVRIEQLVSTYNGYSGSKHEVHGNEAGFLTRGRPCVG